ncbi:hypothetical protein V6N11_018505 [Hibiscus sabdariffa]|uniref:Uncharacterized protein n=1 Tax=Hibiscus sabdariffa TaxID=183260 RepID=A0ABR2T8G3_9ROSI
MGGENFDMDSFDMPYHSKDRDKERNSEEHCPSLFQTPEIQEASSARDKIKRYFGWNDSQSEKEVASASHAVGVESDVTHISKEQSLDSFAVSSDQNPSVIPGKGGHFL